RYLDVKNIEPEFPFGFGLSYSQFKLSQLQVHSLENGEVDASVVVTNTGARAGAEVAQLYVSENSPSLPRPPRELKAFRKVYLESGESQSLQFHLDSAAFSYFDEASESWKSNHGRFTLSVGNSSRAIAESVEVER